MVLNIEQLPEAIREDIEVQSLALLGAVKDVLVIIGGWGPLARGLITLRRGTHST